MITWTKNFTVKTGEPEKKVSVSVNNERINDAVQAGKRAVQRSGDFVRDLTDSARIRLRMGQVQTRLRGKYRALGKIASARMDAGETAFDGAMAQLNEEIRQLKAEWEALRKEL